MPGLLGVRIDKWLWAARFFKTRSLATDAVEGGRVQLNGVRVKPAKEVKRGDRVALSIGDLNWELIVEDLSEKRGPATVARTLYRETEASIAARVQALELRQLRVEPAAEIHGRPTKRDRRRIDSWRDG
ncbi:MAG: RNA-binding protein [Candidatus Dactylopiibacterium carminicum]|uniref:RNA-binding protein n=1 Tax=Candidatus Dactylopiibacterium carminicum TaxID=857335 RepID=A0A272EUK1_9RHOO|nr:RNA-binding S4 domain-containing protein [Candidatus Dactylopiibacterium carminicum]KAF7599772.1 RNA-binding protein [Candidatus Dactylopiibacterium carminicum]PAS93726.1 MAG: RNA-binding protein [Candidatus Dactylopiibacterium carminicum]PAS98273.1 MAG: RNA-binding protein [Candidatus Dactylopiibacterium carminicum]PAS99773.1 MAG: RNA-binding protein [Candidatus Dactylopiibacterium carminicum]